MITRSGPSATPSQASQSSGQFPSTATLSGYLIPPTPTPSILDLSFNLLRAVPEELTRIPALRTLYFVQNKISHIDHLGHLGATLHSLELGGNRIRVNCMPSQRPPTPDSEWTHRLQRIENLEALVNLEELWLGKNKITVLEVRLQPALSPR
jgi:Leucine-rich repeat (LRR) protein